MPHPSATLRISNSLTRTREFNEKLISLVEKTPLLWDTKHPKYKDSFVSSLEWQSIAGQMNCSASDIQLRWKNLRDTFTRRYKVLKEFVKNGRATTPADINCLIRWKYFKKMLFLEDNVRHIKSKKITLASATRQVKEDAIKQEIISEPSGEETQDPQEAAASPCPPEEIQLSLLLTSALEAQEESEEHQQQETTDSRSPLLLLPDLTAAESSESSCGVQFPSSGVPESPEASTSASRQHQAEPSRLTMNKMAHKKALKTRCAMDSSCCHWASSVDYDEAFALSLVAHLKNVPLELKGACQLQLLETVVAFQQGRQPRNLQILDGQPTTHFADDVCP